MTAACCDYWHDDSRLNSRLNPAQHNRDGTVRECPSFLLTTSTMVA